MEKVLITGGAGFIGYHLGKRLLSEEYEIDLLDNFSRGMNDRFLKEITDEKQVRLIDEDLLQYNHKTFRNDYTYVYNLAAIIGVQNVLKAPYDVLVKNVELLKNALVIAGRQKKLKRFVFTSSSEVYASTLKIFGLEFPTPETSPLSIASLKDSRTSYMLSKIYGEAMCIQSGLPVTIIRPHNFYGPRMGLSHVIPELLKKAYESEDKKLDVYSVDHKRTFCFIEDAVEMILLLAESKQTVGEAYNVGNQDDEIYIGNLAKLLLEVVGRDLEINPLPATPGSPERRCPDMTKTFKVTGYSPQYSIEEGLRNTFDWYKQHVFDKDGVTAI